MPATTVSGELLLVFAAWDQSRTVTTPSGWTSVVQSSTSTLRAGLFAKISDGSEGGGTVTFSFSGNTKPAFQTWRIQGWSGSLSDVEAGTASTNSGSNCNPPSVTSSGGSADNLFIAWASIGLSTSSPNSGSTITNYTDERAATSAGTGNRNTMYTWRRALTSASDDPGTCSSFGASFTSIANTVVVRPSTLHIVGLSGSWVAPVGGLSYVFEKTPLSGVAGAFTGTLAKVPEIVIAGAAGSFAGTLVRDSAKLFAGAWAGPTGALTKAKVSVVDLAGSAGAFTGVLVRDIAKSCAGAAGTLSGSLTRLAAKNLDGAWADPSGALTPIHLFVKQLSGISGVFTGVLTRSPRKSLAGVAGAMSGLLTKRPNKPVSGAWGAPSGTLSRMRLKPLAGTAGAFTGTLARQASKRLAGSISGTGTLAKSSTRHLAGAWGAPFGFLGAQTLGILGLLPGASRFGGVVKGAARFFTTGGGSSRFFRPPPGSGRKRS